MALVERCNGYYNFLGTDGTLLDQNSDFISVQYASFSPAYSEKTKEVREILEVIKSDHTVNLLKSDGSYISPNEDFLEVGNINYNFMVVIVKRKNGLYNFLQFDGTLVSPNEDFLDSDIIFRKSKVRVRRKASGKYNYLKIDGTFKYKRDKMFLIPCDVFGN